MKRGLTLVEVLVIIFSPALAALVLGGLLLGLPVWRALSWRKRNDES